MKLTLVSEDGEVVALDEARNGDPRVSGGGREEGIAVAVVVVVVVGEGEDEGCFGGGCAAVFKQASRYGVTHGQSRCALWWGVSFKLSQCADNTMLLSTGTRECPPGFGCLVLLREYPGV